MILLKNFNPNIRAPSADLLTDAVRVFCFFIYQSFVISSRKSKCDGVWPVARVSVGGDFIYVLSTAAVSRTATARAVDRSLARPGRGVGLWLCALSACACLFVSCFNWFDSRSHRVRWWWTADTSGERIFEDAPLAPRIVKMVSRSGESVLGVLPNYERIGEHAHARNRCGRCVRAIRGTGPGGSCIQLTRITVLVSWQAQLLSTSQIPRNPKQNRNDIICNNWYMFDLFKQYSLYICHHTN